MKRTLILLIATISIFISAAAQTVDAVRWSGMARYAADNSAGSRPDYVFMGNSITDFWPGKSPEFFSAKNYIGRGISGQTTAQMLLRFVPDVIERSPKGVLILAGVNDIAENAGEYSEDFTFGNIRAMAMLARSAGIVPVLTTVLPCSTFYWRPDVKDASEKIQSLNSRIKAYAVEQGLYCIDWYPALVGTDARSINPQYSDDGIHPNATGYKIMEAVALPTLQQAIINRR